MQIYVWLDYYYYYYYYYYCTRQRQMVAGWLAGWLARWQAGWLTACGGWLTQPDALAAARPREPEQRLVRCEARINTLASELNACYRLSAALRALLEQHSRPANCAIA